MMPTDPKQKRETDKAYLAYITRQPCIVNNHECCGDVVYHHTVSVGAGGSDYLAIPVCVAHHIPGVHTLGKDTFQKKYNINFDKEIIQLLINFIKLKTVDNLG